MNFIIEVLKGIIMSSSLLVLLLVVAQHFIMKHLKHTEKSKDILFLNFKSVPEELVAAAH